MSELSRIMREVATLSLQQDYIRFSDIKSECTEKILLPPERWGQLAERISALPLDYRSVLYFRYCFDQFASDTEDVLQIEHAKGKLYYTLELLSHIMGCTESLLDEETMRNCCQIALATETEMVDTIQQMKTPPHYSSSFRRKLRQIHAAQSLTAALLEFAKRAAAIILICAIGFSTALLANAELRKTIFDWVVETFPQFSIFIPGNSEQEPVLGDYLVGYIPEGYALENRLDLKDNSIYEYTNTTGEQLTVSLSVSNTISYALNTEGVEIESIIVNDIEVICWEKDETAYILWQNDELTCYIIGKPEMEEMIKILESIKKV